MNEKRHVTSGTVVIVIIAILFATVAVTLISVSKAKVAERAHSGAEQEENGRN